MKIIKTSDYQSLSKEAFKVIKNTLKENNHAVINTTTGASYDGTFNLLVDAINNNEISISESVFTNLDEYIARRDAKFTVYTYMHKKFYNLIKEHPKYIGLIDPKIFLLVM